MQKWFDYNETLPQIFSLQNSEILITFSGWWFSKFSQHKVTNTASIRITLMSLLQYLSTFLSPLCTWRVRSSLPEEFFKKVVLTNFTKFRGKHLLRGLFCNIAAGWRPTTSLDTEFGRGAFLWTLWNLRTSILQTLACNLPLNSKIFTRFSFHKMLGFY